MKSVVKKPWGFFEVLEQNKQYIIKKIKVIPGGILSLQSHFNRSEHWIVVEGEAEVILKHGERKFIPSGGFIGEQSFITGQKTSADVTTGREKTKILRWNSIILRNYIKDKESLKDNIDLILTADLIHKIRKMDEGNDEIVHSRDLKIH